MYTNNLNIKHITTIFLFLLIHFPMGSMAQSLEIVEEFKENKMSTVLTTYKNEFGHREKQHVMDNKFPFAVLEVYLEGDEQAVKAAKSKLSLDLGSHFTVEGVCKTYTNRIVFLISSSVRNVYMTCGDGCKEQVIFSGQTLEQNRIYYGRVKYTHENKLDEELNIDSLKKCVIEEYEKNTYSKNIKIGDLYYHIIDSTHSAEVISQLSAEPYNDNSSLKIINIPSSITYEGKSYSVIEVGENAFANCQKLTSVTLPNTITTIGRGAFNGCFYLENIFIPNNVTFIGEDAFEYTKYWNNLPDGIVYINNILYAYKGNKVHDTSIRIHEGTISISPKAFRYAPLFNSIVIPKSVKHMGKDAIAGCVNLSSILVNKDNLFYDSRENCNAIIETSTNTLIAGCKNTIIPNSVIRLGEGSFYMCSKLTAIEIPNSVLNIGAATFASCSSLASITIGKNVSTIGDYAFSMCSNLSNIYIPKNITYIGNNIFEYCAILTSIVIDNENRKYDSRENCNAIIETETNTLIAGCKNTIIPNSVTSIGSGAFYGCSDLSSVTIPNSVTSIAPSAFGACFGLQTIYIPRGTKDKFAAMEGLKDHVDKLVEQ